MPPSPALKKGLTAVPLALTIYACVSGGPFGLESVISGSGAGLGLLLILLTPIVWALPAALMTAELASAIPVEGGYVVWVQRALGPAWGFLCGWWTWLYSMVDAAIYPVLFTGYLASILKVLFGVTVLQDQPGLRWILGLALVATFTVLNIRGTRLVGRAATVLTAVLTLPFVLFVGVAAFRLLQDPRPLQIAFLPADTGLAGAFAGGLYAVMWNYLGWDSLSTVAEEVENPQSAYPRALLGGVAFVTAIYFFPVLLALFTTPDITRWQEDQWPNLLGAGGGTTIWVLTSIASLVSPMALFLATLLGSSRIPFVLARMGYLPKALVAVHPRFGTPWRAILLCGVIYGALAWQSFSELVKVNVILYSSALLLEFVALIVLRRREPELPRPFRIPGGWPVLAFVVIAPTAMVVLAVASSVQEEGWAAQIPTALILLTGPLVYVVERAVKRRGALG